MQPVTARSLHAATDSALHVVADRSASIPERGAQVDIEQLTVELVTEAQPHLFESESLVLAGVEPS